MCAELQQVLQELGMRNIIYNMDPCDPNEELFTIGMRNLVLHTGPTSLFGSLVTTLAPHIGQPISEATRTLADLREVETIRAQKVVQAMTERRVAKGPGKVSRTQMSVDLIKARVVKENLDGQPNRILLELWHQLKPEQHF